jgi:hypothetical protein
MSTRKKIRVGDHIRFRAITRWSDKPATRKVVGIDLEGRPLVRFGGWDNFIVERREVLEVLPA